jgi:hypothetical protein
MTQFAPCDVDPHPGLSLGRATLESVLSKVDAPWFVRQTCVAFRDTCAAGPAPLETAVCSVERLQLARRCGLPTDHIVAAIAFYGDVDALDWAVGEAYSAEWLCDWAAQGGHVEVMRWARAHGHKTTDKTAWFAAKFGRLEMLEWLRGDGCWMDIDLVMRAAANNGHIRVVEYAHTHGATLDPRLMNVAALGGSVVVLEWLIAHGCPLAKGEAIRLAVKREHLEFADRALAAGCELPPTAISYGVAGLEWIERHAISWQEDGVCTAASNSTTPAACEWLLARGLPWSPQVDPHFRSLAVLEWLDAQGCKWTSKSTELAAAYRRVDWLARLESLGCPIDVDECLKNLEYGFFAFDTATVHHDRLCFWPRRSRTPEVRRWLRESRRRANQT